MKKILLVLFATLSLNVFAKEQSFKELPTDKISEDKILVQEFFYYGCPHCYSMEKDLEEWKKNIDLNKYKVEQVPVIFGYMSVDAAKHHYVAEMFGFMETFKKEYFNQIINKKQRISDGLAIEILTRLGANKEKVIEAMESYKISKMVKNSLALSKNYGIVSVPSFVVNGKYYIDAETAGSKENIFNTIESVSKK